MKAVYDCAIGFITVKNAAQVDYRATGYQKENFNANEYMMKCIHKSDTEFEEYLTRAKDNRLCKLKEICFSPDRKKDYIIRNIKVLEKTEVITFGNNARVFCPCPTAHTYLHVILISYIIRFSHTNPKDNYMVYVHAHEGRNRFMVNLMVKESTLTQIDYQIGFDQRTEYEEDNKDNITETKKSLKQRIKKEITSIYLMDKWCGERGMNFSEILGFDWRKEYEEGDEDNITQTKNSLKQQIKNHKPKYLLNK